MPPLQDLSAEQRQLAARQLGLIGECGQRELAGARVLVIGAGGLGSPVLLYLAGAGVGTLGVVDDDLVAVSNLHRQVIHSMDRVGDSKVASAAASVAQVNPTVTVVQHEVRLDARSAAGVLAGYDVVVDGSDNFATRYLVSDAAELAGLPVVWGSVLRFGGQVSVFWARSQASNGRGPTLRDLFPTPPPPEAVPSCAQAGVLGSVTGVIGSLMATEVVKLIVGQGEPLLGRVLVYDGLAGTFGTVPLQPRPDREPVTELAAVPDPPWAVGAADLTANQLLVDVREDWELRDGMLPGARHVPLATLLHDGVPALGPDALEQDVVLYCQAGPRSRTAAEALAASFGHREVRVGWLVGGYDDWRTVTPPQACHQDPSAPAPAAP